MLGRDEIIKRMAARRCERRMRDYCFSVLPSWKNILQGDCQQVLFEARRVHEIYTEELEKYQQPLSEKGYESLITRYPIRYSGVLKEVSKAMRCRNTDDYEDMVIARLDEENELAAALKVRMETLSTSLSN